MKQQRPLEWRGRKLAVLWIILVVGAAVTLIWREIRETQTEKGEPGLAGISLPELLNVRITSPMLAENNPGLSAALLAHLARVCRELPSSKDVANCLGVVQPASENLSSLDQLPPPLNQFPPVKAFFEDWKNAWPAATVPPAFTPVEAGITDWTVQISHVQKTAILWLRPTGKLQGQCGFLRPPEGLKPPGVVNLFNHLGETVEPVQISGLGPSTIGREYILFPTGDIVTWRPGKETIEPELKRWKTLESRPCFIQASYFAPPFSPTFRYSSPYLDRAGLGFNVTITGPPREYSGVPMIPGMDVTFDPESLAGPMGRFAALVPVEKEAPFWEDLAAALKHLDQSDKRELSERLQRCISNQGIAGHSDGRFLQCPERLTTSGEHTIAMHLGEKKWLIAILAPEAASSWPLWMGPLLAISLLAGIVWLVLRTRRTERGSEALVDAFDRLGVPILITDPNSDIIHGASLSALKYGFVPEKKFLDSVEETAQAQYQTNQSVGQERRGYGTRIKDVSHARSVDAIVRSADVRANVEHLGAAPGDRLALVLPLDPENDLFWIQADLRQQFAELLDHGIVALISGLDVLIKNNPALAQDVFRLLLRNQKFVLALFSSPDKAPASSNPADVIVLRDGFDLTLSVLRRVFLAAGAQLELREILGLEGGTLDGLSDAPPEVFREEIQWPDGLALRVQLTGAIGFFITEALRNALRHGEPRSIPLLQVRQEGLHMTFTVRNAIRNNAITEVRKKQGGLQLMKMAAKALGWEFDAGPDRADETQFVCCWVVKMIEAKPA
ncbi:MAG TPA: hypothetical protein VHA33_03670 [Candidatus Angelobacter sp.]|nr:hypothetical protein [Candidatus Angelobacter sp.]